MDSSPLSVFRGSPFLAGRVVPAALMACAFSASAQIQDFEGQKVVEVAIRYNGPKTVDEAALRNSISTRAGDPYKADKVDTDITALYEGGKVDDVRVLAEPVGGGVKVIFEVTTRATFVGVGFIGNSVFTDAKLAKETGLKAGGVLSDQDILAARQALEKYYEGYGYPDVTVTHKVQASQQVPNGTEIIFLIDEGQKNEIRDIRFEGNHTYDSRTLRKQLKVKEKGLFSFLTKSGRFETDQLDSDLESVLDYYRTRGYLRVSSPGIRREPVGDGRVDLVIPINEGEKYTVEGVGFGRMTVFRPEELYPALSLEGGSAYSSAKVRDDIKMIRSYYGSRGYADAVVTPDIRDAGPNKVNIIYRITEGSRYRVGRVNIEGNTKTQDKVIRRELTLKPEDYFNSVELETAKSRLQGLLYFSDVQVTAENSGRAGYRDVNVLVEERRTGSISAGVGFSSIDSVVGFVSLEQTNFDIRNPWAFTGGGQRFGADLRVGSERTDFGVSLTEPWFMGRKLELGTELFYRDSQYYSDIYDQKNVGAAISLRKPLSEKTAIRGEYRIENISIDLDSSVAPTSLFQAEDGDYLRSAVGVSFIYDNRDAPVETRTGEKFEIGVNLAGTAFGGDVDTFTFTAQGQKYWNLWFDSILSINGELAFVDGTDGDVPIFDRLFLGGGRTLRGFEFRDVGPRDPDTKEVLGGQSLGFVSIEYSVPVIDQVRAAMFYDMGFVNGDSWEPDPGDLYSDVGIGVRLKLPISPIPIALDYAIPLDSPDREADKGGQFNFYMNYNF